VRGNLGEAVHGFPSYARVPVIQNRNQRGGVRRDEIGFLCRDQRHHLGAIAGEFRVRRRKSNGDLRQQRWPF
jgi:hypothetical protein